MRGVVVHGFVDALDVHVLRLGGGNLKSDRPERAHLGNDLQNKRQYAAPKARLAVTISPLLLVLRPRQVVEKFSFVEIRSIADDLLATRQQRDPRHLRNDAADGASKGSNRQIFVMNDVV